jgi:hypothetical protein
LLTAAYGIDQTWNHNNMWVTLLSAEQADIERAIAQTESSCYVPKYEISSKMPSLT